MKQLNGITTGPPNVRTFAYTDNFAKSTAAGASAAGKTMIGQGIGANLGNLTGARRTS